MKCIICNKQNTHVSNSRSAEKGTVKWRRRECKSCGNIFTTRETSRLDNLFVIKSNKKRQRFIYEKLLISLFTILNTHKIHDNGTNALLAKKTSDKILNKLYQHAENKDISSDTIVLIAYNELKKLDESFAEQYIYYSEHRRKVAQRAKIIN